MKKLISLATAALLFLTGSSIYLYNSQEERLFLSEITTSDYKYEFSTAFEEVYLDRGDAVIHGLHFKQEQPKGVVLFFHGQGSTIAAKWGKIGLGFVEKGYDCLVIDYRGCGKSQGSRSEKFVLEDALSAYDYLQTNYKEENIVVYGNSLGTGFATHVAANRNPKQLILVSPYYSMVDLAPKTIPYLPSLLVEALLKYPLRTDLAIQQVECPIHIFHSLHDELIPYDSSLRLLELVQKDKNIELTTLEHVRHSDVHKTRIYNDVMTRLLE